MAEMPEGDFMAVMAKEPGLNSFKPLGPKPKDLKELARQYLETEDSFRDSIKQSVEEGRDITKLEKDLSAFYTTINNKFKTNISSHDEFVEFVKNLEDYQDLIQNSEEKVRDSIASDDNLKPQSNDAEPPMGKFDVSKDLEILNTNRDEKKERSRNWHPRQKQWKDWNGSSSQNKNLDKVNLKSQSDEEIPESSRHGSKSLDTDNAATKDQDRGLNAGSDVELDTNDEF